MLRKTKQANEPQNFKTWQEGPDPVLLSHYKGPWTLHCASSESTEWELELGGKFGRRRRVLPPSFSLLVVPLLDSLPPVLYSAPAAAISQPGWGYQIFPAMFGCNREGVRGGFLCRSSYICMEKFPPQNDVVPGRWRKHSKPEELLNGRSCEFFMLCGFLKYMWCYKYKEKFFESMRVPLNYFLREKWVRCITLLCR